MNHETDIVDVITGLVLVIAVITIMMLGYIWGDV